ncbi:aspartyl/asparaginyl beta-hydroxylase [Caballeronia temeraria]|uniref:Aspartyl/asparaginyl beta-hydroxylase n=1 Tax=Caballeronia temeraria TaxID=1777137 RepID=A0A158DMH7_9BURK|nr:aspartyl/asparaginyl beta-hydroxylase domain-containing protein [Caballeronia temeraria]SAK95851.1 aspartyl/asparaginyl beta-hydroxylase [Caballeronia temeraria]
MKNFMRIASGLDTVPLNLAIQRRPEIWKADTYLRDYPQGPFGQIESILLRFPPRSVHETEEALKAHLENFDQHECVDQDVYKVLPEARPIVMGLMARVGGERLGRVIINKIAPGGRIFPHADTPVHAQYWDRFHVVLQSAPGVYFRTGDEDVYMAPGETWWFQNAEEHEVINNSNCDRIHMVVDIRTSKP